MRLGIMELWKEKRVLGDKGLENLVNLILSYDGGVLRRILDSCKCFDRRIKDIGARLERGWIFNFGYYKNDPRANPNIPILIKIKDSEGVDVLYVVSKSRDLCFTNPLNITGSPSGKGYPEVGIVFVNLLYINDGVDTNNLILHEMGEALGLRHYPPCTALCTGILRCDFAEDEPEIKKCEYYGYVMCCKDNSKGLHPGDYKKLGKVLKA